VQRSIINDAGKEVVVAILGRETFGEKGVWPGRDRYWNGYRGHIDLHIAHERKDDDAEHELSDRFTYSILTRNIRVEADLADQLFNSTEKRLPACFCCSHDTVRKISLKSPDKDFARDAG
jgi:CRP/FNR family cyclic AMP-dependent transcriptional regulator